MLTVARTKALFPGLDTGLYLTFKGKLIGQATTPEESNHLAPIQLMFCATAKKLIGDVVTQYNYVGKSMPAVANETWWDIKEELQKFESEGRLEIIQPWLTEVIIPKLTSLIPKHNSPTTRSMRDKLIQIEAIATYDGEWAAALEQEFH
jgi:hypothetical protein